MKRRPRRLPVYLSPAEAERLLACARCPRDRVLFAVMLLAGLRVAEACALRVERIDLSQGQLLVYQGKGGKDRLLPVAARLAVLLRDWIGVRSEGHLFPGRFAGRALTTRAARYAVVGAAGRAGITRPQGQVSPHKLRHSFASALVARDVDLVVIRDLMGHSSLATTSIYLHTSLSKLRSAVDLL